MIKTLSIIIGGGFLSGIIGHLFMPAIGFVVGVMVFTVGYCCMTLDDPPESSNLP